MVWWNWIACRGPWHIEAWTEPSIRHWLSIHTQACPFHKSFAAGPLLAISIRVNCCGISGNACGWSSGVAQRLCRPRCFPDQSHEQLAAMSSVAGRHPGSCIPTLLLPRRPGQGILGCGCRAQVVGKQALKLGSGNADWAGWGRGCGRNAGSERITTTIISCDWPWLAAGRCI